MPSTSVPTVVVTGANRGLGLEFARRLAADRWRVHAAVRDPARAEAMAAAARDAGKPDATEALARLVEDLAGLGIKTKGPDA